MQTALKKSLQLAGGREARNAFSRACLIPMSGLKTTTPAQSDAGKSPLYQYGGVHGTRKSDRLWRNKPLFRRAGDVRFRTGREASDMLSQECRRRDPSKTLFLNSFDTFIQSISPIFDRQPKYAWIAKQLMEPERIITFRVAWLDDSGIARVNRGYRIQFSSVLGPYEGGTHFAEFISTSSMKSLGLSQTFTNALSGCNLGGSAGGADFDATYKSEAEIQRFCQSYMTELSKYIGPDMDYPGQGVGVSETEIGYMYGQYKRIEPHVSKAGSGVLWGGQVPYPYATGYGVVHFMKQLITDKFGPEGLRGKRCLITGCGKVASGVASKLLEFGAIPITFSDESGHVFEEGGFDANRLRTIMDVRADRGAKIGRYIIASTTARYNEPENIFSIPCDYVIPCIGNHEMTEKDVHLLADNGCKAVIEGSHMPCTSDALAAIKKRGLLLAPGVATLAGATIASGETLDYTRNGSSIAQSEKELDGLLSNKMSEIYNEAKATAREYNLRGDLLAGANMSGFLRVANVMLTHGAV